ncbi:MAG: hypothetical protein NVS2B17_34450 [Candidatus Velthaea sp.]
MITTKFSLTIPENAWSTDGPEDNPRAKLHVNVILNGTSMHLEAFAVNDYDFNEQKAQCFAYDPEFDAIQTIQGGAVKTTEIFGAAYVLAMTPHQQ